jgi:hypothetical protein
MRQSARLTYADAVKVLAGGESPTVALLDRLAGGALLLASASGVGLALSLFDAKAELAAVTRSLLDGLSQRLAGAGRVSRTEQLAAAHAVVAITAYFDEVAGLALPFNVAEPGMDRRDEVRLAGGEPIDGDTRSLAAALLRSDVPQPGPQYPYEVTLERVRGFYEHLSVAVLRFVSGLALWDRLDETERARLTSALANGVPDGAIVRYEGLVRRLAAECPEVALWLNLMEHQATRSRLASVHWSLTELERLLAGLVAGNAPAAGRAILARVHQAALREPILASGLVPEGLQVPSLEEGYVDPCFRAADAGAGEPISEQRWWDCQDVRDDLPGFLAGHLTSPRAMTAPLLVLGQPGAGKSVLTHILAARLAPEDFLVVRVDLRDTPADADVQTQLEHGIRTLTGERVSWPELARTADGALCVVLLDGFDELLQVTGVTQSDYLERVAMFQRAGADRGQPTAVVVTSRTAVAERARPSSGMTAVHLEPFNEAQVRHWLEIWNSRNASYLAARNLTPLTDEAVLRNPDLASQPLLLMMLALYDAEENRLQREDAALGEAELYERLLRRFAAREVGKSGAGLPESALKIEVEREMRRLSIAAFAMFNRNRLWTTEQELDDDLAALREADERQLQAGFRAALTPGGLAIGRFFFIHQSRATRDGYRLRTFEFLHATFGEYLVARMVLQELQRLVDAAQLDLARLRHPAADDAYLYALLSFTALTARGDSIVSFLQQGLEPVLTEPDRRTLLRGALLRSFHLALLARRDDRYGNYEPAPLTVPARLAAWSANLLLLTVLVAGDVTASDLFPDAAEEPKLAWHEAALLWRGQLKERGWTSLIHAFELIREWRNGHPEVRIRLATGDREPPVDPYWTYGYGPGSTERGNLSWMFREADALRRQSRFICGHDEDVTAHTLEPLIEELNGLVVAFAGLLPDRCVSATHALVLLWIASGRQAESSHLEDAYDTCLWIFMHAFGPEDDDALRRYGALILHQLVADRERVSREWLAAAVAMIQPTSTRLTASAVADLSLIAHHTRSGT